MSRSSLFGASATSRPGHQKTGNGGGDDQVGMNGKKTNSTVRTPVEVLKEKLAVKDFCNKLIASI